ncbi:TPA: hypothetical protein ACIBE3_002451 [Salmonella enterica subsp. enterica serovar Reading]
MVKTHTGMVEITTALGKVRLYHSDNAWVVSAGETYNPETGKRNGGTGRASVLLRDTIRALPGEGKTARED